MKYFGRATVNYHKTLELIHAFFFVSLSLSLSLSLSEFRLI